MRAPRSGRCVGDPVVAAARLIDQVTDEVMENSLRWTATFGRVDTDPGMLNVIAGRVHLLLDMRDKEEERLRMREAQLFRRLEALREQGFGAEAVRTQWTPPVAMDPTLVKDIHAAAEAEGLSYLHMNSGAGHDAMVFGKLLPTAMIFIPSQKRASATIQWRIPPQRIWRRIPCVAPGGHVAQCP